MGSRPGALGPDRYVVGVDFGTLSGRAVVVRTRDGAALGSAVPAALEAAGVDPAAVVGIGTDFTASTPLPVLRDGTPLCELPEYRGRPHAYPKLWKHHAAQAQAERVTAVAAERGEPWLPRYGGRISSEWQFAKALQLLEEDPDLYAAMDRWIEAADWI